MQPFSQQAPQGRVLHQGQDGHPLAKPQTAAILGKLMKKFVRGNAMVSSMGKMSHEIMQFMNNMRLSDALKMAGAAFPMAAKLALNRVKK